MKASSTKYRTLVERFYESELSIAYDLHDTFKFAENNTIYLAAINMSASQFNFCRFSTEQSVAGETCATMSIHYFLSLLRSLYFMDVINEQSPLMSRFLME